MLKVAPLGSAPARPLAVPPLGSCASSGRTLRLWELARHSQGEAQPLGAQPLPRVLELAASKAADFTCFDPSGEACLFTGGFAHYQFYAQSVGFQVAKIKTHLDAGDRKNAKVYKEYVSIFRGGTGSGRRSSYRFDALVFDQVMRYRVSCRHWVCPACAARASDQLRISV